MQTSPHILFAIVTRNLRSVHSVTKRLLKMCFQQNMKT